MPRRWHFDSGGGQVDAEALYLESDGVYTSAGITAGIDLALSLLTEDQGLALAAEVARELVMFLHRPGNQTQFSEGLKAQVSSQGKLRRLVDRDWPPRWWPPPWVIRS